MRKVLVVDDEQTFTDSLSEILVKYQDKFEVVTAANGEEAIHVLKAMPVDLLVTDLKMPKIDGFNLLAYVNHYHPTTPAIVFTAYGTPEIEAKAKMFGAIGYIEKPIEIGVLAEKIISNLEATSLGFIRGITLPSILQLVELEKKNCTLEVKSGRLAGAFFFDNGELLDAEIGELRSEEAAYKILALTDTDITILNVCNRKKHNIHSSLTKILMESARRKDEAMEKVRTNTFSVNKEVVVNVSKLNEAVEYLKENLGSGLVATDIFGTADGQAVAGYNSQPKASALFNQVTQYLIKALKGSGFPGLGNYYTLHLTDGMLVIVLPLDKFQWGMLLDMSKVQLGLVMNVVLPEAIKLYEKAITG